MITIAHVHLPCIFTHMYIHVHVHVHAIQYTCREQNADERMATL